MITERMAKSTPWCFPVMEQAHVLIAGTTGSGKSVCLNTLLYNIYRKHWNDPNSFGLYLIDPKRVELRDYKNSRPVIGYETEPDRISDLLDFIIEDMEGVYNRMRGKKSTEFPRYIVIDELADIVSDKKILEKIIKIGRLGRAAQFHLICCTQDPSRNTLSAAFMQNMTCCIGLKCKSETESKQIIGKVGLETFPIGYAWIEGSNLKSDVVNITSGSFEVPMTPDEDIREIIDSTDLFWGYDKYLKQREKDRWTLAERIRGHKDLLAPPECIDPRLSEKLKKGYYQYWIEC